MPEPKTQKNDKDVAVYLAQIAPAQLRADSQKLATLLSEATGEPPAMWGDSIIGFGERPLRYPNGKIQTWMLIAFSPRKSGLVLYIMDGFEAYGELLSQLGPHKTGKGCLYLKPLDKLNQDVLKELIRRSVAAIRQITASP